MSLAVSRSTEPLPAVRGDARRLKQVFTNLLSNAIKFTRPAAASSSRRAALTTAAARSRIRDTGVGMNEEEIQVALTPFGQVDGSRSRWREGTGLGLPIAKALIELHGGELGIRRAARIEGTEVTVTLPSPQTRVRACKTAVASRRRARPPRQS